MPSSGGRGRRTGSPRATSSARGLDRSYGWDLDRLIHSFGPDWVVDGEGRVHQAHAWDAQTYLELRPPPPSEP